MEIVAFDLNDKSLLKEFIELPYSLYPGRYAWIPPLRQLVSTQLSAENPFFLHAEARAFLCRVDGVVVGRLLATRDHNLVKPNGGPTIGHFGYFECIEDPIVASRLLERAESWLKSRGVSEIHGPIQCNIFIGYRLQTRGFEASPFLGEPRNPPYYQKLLLECGYIAGPCWHSWDLTAEQVRTLADSTEQHILPSDDITLRPLDMNHLDEELFSFYPLALATFAENYGFSPLDCAEMHPGFLSVARLFTEKCFYLATNRDKIDIGYVFGYPDLAKAFCAMNGETSQFFNCFSSHPAERYLLHTIAVSREYRKSSATYQLMNILLAYAANRNQPAVGCLAKEGRTVYDNVGPSSRSYHIFEKKLADARP